MVLEPGDHRASARKRLRSIVLSYLIDTNILSELRRKSPDPGVVGWFSQRPPATLHRSVPTLGEIRRGIEDIDAEIRRQLLIDWLETDLPTFFTGRILSVDGAVADRWGRLVAAAGRPLSAIDSLLAATALEHDLVLVTRNIKGFFGLPVQIFNPWSV